MAFADLDRIYRERLVDQKSSRPVLNFGGNYLGYNLEAVFGTIEPERITRAMLVFGYFNGNKRMQCQPWIAMSVGSQAPFHADAHIELYDKHSKTNALAFSPLDEKLSGHFWNMYIGSEDSYKLDSYTAYVGLAMHQNRYQQEKLLAAAEATMPGQVLEDHIICAKFEALGGQTVYIQNGQIHELSDQLG